MINLMCADKELYKPRQLIMKKFFQFAFESQASESLSIKVLKNSTSEIS